MQKHQFRVLVCECYKNHRNGVLWAIALYIFVCRQLFLGCLFYFMQFTLWQHASALWTGAKCFELSAIIDWQLNLLQVRLCDSGVIDNWLAGSYWSTTARRKLTENLFCINSSVVMKKWIDRSSGKIHCFLATVAWMLMTGTGAASRAPVICIRYDPEEDSTSSQIRLCI